MEGAAEGVLQEDSCGGELEVANPRRKEARRRRELGEELSEEDEENYRLEQREEEKDWVADELLQRPDVQVPAVAQKGRLYRLLVPNIVGAFALLTSSIRILLPVWWRKMSSSVGEEKLTEPKRILLLSSALTMSAMITEAFLA